VTDNNIADLNDVDLDIDPEEELAKIKALEESDDDTEDGIEEDVEEGASAEDGAKPASEVANPDTNTELLEELRQERARLQQQLQELAMSALADKRRLENIEQHLSQPKVPEAPPEPQGPTPEQIAHLLDRRIAEVDAALTQAEMEDPASVPQLRQQLRQLERYYTNFVANQTVAQVKGPDPQEVIQRAVQETNTVNRFNAIKQNIITEFPILDVKSEFFSSQLRDQIHKIYNPMLAQGADPTEALIEATSLVVKAHGVLPLSEIIRQKEQELSEQGNKLTKEEAAAKRKLAQVEKNIKAAQDTPPSMATTGKTTDSAGVLDKYDFQKMSLKEFDKLSESELEMIENTLMMYN